MHWCSLQAHSYNNTERHAPQSPQIVDTKADECFFFFFLAKSQMADFGVTAPMRLWQNDFRMITNGFRRSKTWHLNCWFSLEFHISRTKSSHTTSPASSTNIFFFSSFFCFFLKNYNFYIFYTCHDSNKNAIKIWVFLFLLTCWRSTMQTRCNFRINGWNWYIVNVTVQKWCINNVNRVGICSDNKYISTTGTGTNLLIFCFLCSRRNSFSIHVQCSVIIVAVNLAPRRCKLNMHAFIYVCTGVWVCVCLVEPNGRKKISHSR